MERPLSDKRPVGPFAQSGNFRDTLLDSGNSEKVKEGNELMVSVIHPRGVPQGDVLEMLENVAHLPELEQFTVLANNGEFSGEKEQVTTGRDVEVAGHYYYVDATPDPEVTVGQLERFLESEIQGGVVNVNEVNVHKV
jgi:hypothetical protein